MQREHNTRQLGVSPSFSVRGLFGPIESGVHATISLCRSALGCSTCNLAQNAFGVLKLNFLHGNRRKIKTSKIGHKAFILIRNQNLRQSYRDRIQLTVGQTNTDATLGVALIVIRK